MSHAYIKKLLKNNRLFERFRYRRFFKQFHKISAEDAKISSEYLSNSWKDTSIPYHQFELVKEQLFEYHNGHSNPAFDSITNILTRNIQGLNSCTVLEVGCSSGYYSEVFQIKGILSKYHGCDYSPEFIKLARKCYPHATWAVGDATALSYGDDSFDIVISGNCILHIYNFKAAIIEAVRVARKYVVFHLTPVNKKETSYYTKFAYGVKMLEIHFCEDQLIKMMTSQGLKIIDEKIIDSFLGDEENEALSIKTYLCEKAQ